MERLEQPIIEIIEDVFSACIVVPTYNEAENIEKLLDKIFLNEKEQLQFILEGFPGIGPKAAKKLRI